MPRSERIVRLLSQAGPQKEGENGKKNPHVYEISGAEVYYHPGLSFISVWVPERYSEQRSIKDPRRSATSIIEDVHETIMFLKKEPPIEGRSGIMD